MIMPRYMNPELRQIWGNLLIGGVMKRVIVRYKVKEDRALQNIEFIEDVFSSLKKSKPGGLRYASFQLEDGVSFIHIASIETEDGANPLVSLDEFKAFTQDIVSRCEEPPVSSAVETIGNYRVFE
jgi:hypothetical protein